MESVAADFLWGWPGMWPLEKKGVDPDASGLSGKQHGNFDVVVMPGAKRKALGPEIAFPL